MMTVVDNNVSPNYKNKTKNKEMYLIMDMVINQMVEILSQCVYMCVCVYQITAIYTKYLTSLLVNYTPIKLERKQNNYKEKIGRKEN